VLNQVTRRPRAHSQHRHDEQFRPVRPSQRPQSQVIDLLGAARRSSCNQTFAVTSPYRLVQNVVTREACAFEPSVVQVLASNDWLWIGATRMRPGQIDKDHLCVYSLG
jgi:hypothetical protein